MTGIPDKLPGFSPWEMTWLGEGGEHPRRAVVAHSLSERTTVFLSSVYEGRKRAGLPGQYEAAEVLISINVGTIKFRGSVGPAVSINGGGPMQVVLTCASRGQAIRMLATLESP